MNYSKFKKNPIVYILVLLLASAATYFGVDIGGKQQPDSQFETSESGKSSNTIEQAFQKKQSEVWVNVSGQVKKILADDNDGSRHQRFILALDSRHTVLVAHNIDLADKVPVKKSDTVTIRGRYEWNQKGGVLHWTHHDPSGKLKGGWIEYDGKTYK